ncbi:FabD/lysophospholipase-like protein, partial [Glonium stellatum]
LDGGGIRAYSSLLILHNLMKEVAALEHEETTEFLPCHYFDYVAGTSTGGLIAMMLGRMRMSVDKCLSEFIKLKERNLNKGRLSTHYYVLPRKKRTWPNAAYGKAFEALFDSHIDTGAETQYEKAGFKSEPGRCKT